MRTLAMRHGEKEHIRFIVFGALNTGLCFVIYSGGILMGFNYAVANAIAWVIGVVVAFLLNSRFVFRKVGQEHKRFPIFVLSNIFSLVVSMGVLTLLVRGLAVHPIMASIVTIPVVVAMNFVAAKFIVFT